MQVHGGNGAGKNMPMGKMPKSKGKMPKSMGKGMFPNGHNKPSKIPASTGRKLHKSKGR
jgi:hypothetical protein